MPLTLTSGALFVGAAIIRTGKVLLRIGKWLLIGLGTALAAFFLIVFVGDFLFATPRDHAYRNLHPKSKICIQDSGWTILADYNNYELAAISWGQPEESLGSKTPMFIAATCSATGCSTWRK